MFRNFSSTIFGLQNRKCKVKSFRGNIESVIKTAGFFVTEQILSLNVKFWGLLTQSEEQFDKSI